MTTKESVNINKSDRLSAAIDSPRVARFIVIAVGALLLIAAVSKAIQPEQVVLYLDRVLGIGLPLAFGLTLLVLCVEVAIALRLILVQSVHRVVAEGWMLIAVFTIWLGVVAVIRPDLDCPCFGRLSVHGDSMSVLYSLVRNILLLLALGAVWLGRGEAGNK